MLTARCCNNTCSLWKDSVRDMIDGSTYSHKLCLSSALEEGSRPGYPGRMSITTLCNITLFRLKVLSVKALYF